MAATTMHGDIVRLSDEQFDKLVELLTPGYEMAKIFLAQHRPQDERPEPEMQDAGTTSAIPSAPATKTLDDLAGKLS